MSEHSSRSNAIPAATFRLRFPTSANALIHKSPAPAKDARGNVLHRLLLKVDLAPVELDEVEFI